MDRIYLCLLGVSLFLRAESACTPLSDHRKTELSKYVQQKYRLASDAEVTLTENDNVNDTCYRRVRFRSSNPRYRFDVALYLSPDARFLTTDLSDSTIDPAAAERERVAALRRKIEQNDGAASRGPADAPVTMVVFSDFQCPFCSQLAKGLANEIIPTEGDTIRIVFRNFPLDMHPWARQAAEAATCAGKQNHEYFWKIHDDIFDHQKELKSAELRGRLISLLNTEPNFNKTEFESCIDQHKTAASIEKDLALGVEAGVGATPTLFVNGQKISGYHAEQVRTFIHELSQPIH